MIEVKRKDNETNTSLLRRFSRKIKESSVLKQAKAARFSRRKLSELKEKQRALKRIEKTKEREKLRKLGKIE
ncbi:MAG: 30S ribosomal protein S21 [Patescibacteria group bacterium]